MVEATVRNLLLAAEFVGSSFVVQRTNYRSGVLAGSRAECDPLHCLSQICSRNTGAVNQRVLTG